MTKCLRQPCFGFVLLLTITFPTASTANDAALAVENVRHLKVFCEKGRFAGWPANNGIWQWLANPVEENGEYSGNPPSLVRLADGRLCITYANRNEPRTIRAVFSGDDGAAWGREYILRHGAGEPDISYTRTVQRLDDELVTVYYWLDEPRTKRYVAAPIWSAPQGN